MYKYLFFLIFVFLYSAQQSSHNRNIQTIYTSVGKKNFTKFIFQNHKKEIYKIIFITVAPKKDTTLVLKNYIQNFYAGFLAIRSTQDKTITLDKQLAIFYYKDQLIVKEKKYPSHQKNLPTTNYPVNDSGSMLLLDDKANLVGTFSTPHRTKKITQVLLEKIYDETKII